MRITNGQERSQTTCCTTASTVPGIWDPCARPSRARSVARTSGVPMRLRQGRITPPLSNDELRNDIPGHALVQNSPIHQPDLPVDLAHTGRQSRKHVRTEDHLLTQRVLGRRRALIHIVDGKGDCEGACRRALIIATVPSRPAGSLTEAI
jgi:hypothetical protein